MRPVVVMIVVVMMMMIVVVVMIVVVMMVVVLGHDQRLFVGGNIGRRPFILYPQSVGRIRDRVQQFLE